MRYDYNKEHWQKVKVKGVPCLFNDLRIDRGTVSDGKFLYEVADGDCDGIPARIRPGILVNFFGTLVCDVPFVPDEGDTVWLEDGDWEWVE